MTERVIDIATLPKPDRNNGWLEILPPLPDPVRISGPLSVDYAVVGGGFAGLAAARRLGELNPSASIGLIEAGRIGNNAAGRCSGFAIDQAHNIRASDFAGQLEAERDQLTLNRAGQDYLRASVRQNAIDCDWREEGKIHAAATPRGAGLLDAYAGNLDMLGLPYARLDGDDLSGITGTPFYKAGLETPGTILMQPAALVTGLARTMPENVAVYEDSPVTRVEYGQVHRLTTPGGTVSTQTVVLANNGFGKLFGFYERHIIPIATYGSLTRPMTGEEAATLGGRESWGVIPADPFGTSVRRMADNRILIRNIYAYAGGMNPTERSRLWARRKHERSLARRFPMLPGIGFDYTWGGPLALSRNGNPVFGRLAERVFGALCQNGVGIARGTIYGRLIAEEISGHDSEELEIMRKAGRPDRLPPRPFLDIGVEANFAIRRAKAGIEL